MIFRSNRTILSRLRLLAFSLIFSACYTIFNSTPSFAWTTYPIPVSQRLRAIYFVDDNNGYAVGDYGDGTNIIKFTTAAGWVIANPAGTSTLHDVYFTSVSNGCVVGGSIYCTDNGTVSWNSYSDGGVNFETIAFSTTDIGFAGSNNDGWLYRTNDDGDSWAPDFNTGDGNGIVDLEFVPGGDGFLVTDNGSTFFYDSVGDSWNAANSVPIPSGDIKDASCVDALTCWVSGSNGAVAYTTDGGTNWISDTVGTDDIDGIHFRDALNGYLVNDNFEVWSTSDGGSNWNLEYNTGFNTDDVFVTPNGTVWIVGNNMNGDLVVNLTPGVTITESGGSTDVNETGPTNDTYDVVLTTQPTNDVVITVTSTDIVTGVTVNSPLTFTNGNWDTPQSVTVTAVDDPNFEGTHTTNITHTAASVDTDYDAIAITSVTTNITDNDFAIIVKQAWEVGGTAPLASTVTVPTNARLVFLLYVKNTSDSPANDLTFTDALDTSLFDYIPGTIFKDDGTLTTASSNLQIFNSTQPGTGVNQTDASGIGDNASACTLIITCPGGAADLLTFGASTTQGNLTLDVPANSTVAFRFEVTIK